MSKFIPLIKYVILTIKHKYFVLVAGIRIGVPLYLLLMHDMSKFLPSELPHYAKQFFGSKDDPIGFILCWTHHQNRNPHHWEYWIPRTGHNRCDPPYKDMFPIDIPDKYIREMVADWIGASRAYEGKYPDRNWQWLKNNFKDIRVSPSTRNRIMSHIYKAIPDIHFRGK